MPTLPTVDPREVGDDLLLDVREDDEWAAGRAPGAVHLPMSELVERLAEVPADRPVAVVCRSGHRSAQVTAYLVAQGRSARNVDGGMAAWAQLGLPLEAAPGATPRIV
ncbi:MAG TPA: rhodanese-like domain-containing protein [Mycobacteriales bacterium]|jgi:rhodanese-related sulfurtransferase|nr:rhodanese-like domain-containing protein [Mycobacteriales bacterium]